MAAAARHRAPDGIRCWLGDGAGLGHLGHHLFPEDASHRQPLTARDGRCTVVADGRLDNRDELRALLDGHGSQLPVEAPDAALILEAFRCWDSGCAVHLLGDFAVVVLDHARRRLFAARDAMGMRPLYYRAEPGRLLLASEIKQILAAPGVPRGVCEPYLGAHLSGVSAPLEWTAYDGILQLPPAHALVATPAGMRTWRYWDVDPAREIRYGDLDQYAEHLRELFLAAVGARLRTSEPVGIFLSGGLDSSSTAAAAARLGHRVHAYCWAFDDLRECDERGVSDRLVRHYDLPVTYVPADAAWPLAGYPLHGPDEDDPFIGAFQALIETTLESARAERIGTMLSGDRGDLVAGDWVPHYLAPLRHGRWREFRDEIASHARWSGESISAATYRYALRPALRAIARRLRPRWPARWPPPWPPWIRHDFAERAGLRDIASEAARAPVPVSGYSRAERYRAVFMPFHMRGMVWSDRTYARFGLAFADAWSDRRLAEFVLAVPAHVVAHPGGPPKRLARESMRGIIPEDVLADTVKVPPYPLYRLALEDRAADTIRSLLRDMRIARRGYVDGEALCAHYEDVAGGGREHPCLWWALSLEMWLRRFWD
jgi:asparagine synthase (glutamine-hydrolysing)